MDIDHLKRDIVEHLCPLDPEKVILFGSYAYGNPGIDSDLDIYIVSKEDFIPQSYSENLSHYRKYANKIRHLKKIIPVDIIVHTLQMSRIFDERGSSLAREINTKGLRLI